MISLFMHGGPSHMDLTDPKPLLTKHSGSDYSGEVTFSFVNAASKITDFAIRCNRTARPYTWTYDARADHARHLARHARHSDSAATRPAPASGLPIAA